MDDKQMKMLSVKSAIERMVQNHITTHTQVGDHNSFFGEIERLVASFFVGRQIDNNYLVRSDVAGDLEICFSVGGHSSAMTFLLNEKLRWRVVVKQRHAPVYVPQEVDTPVPQSALKQRGAGVGDIMMPRGGIDMSAFANSDVVCEGSIRHNTATGGLEMYTNGRWVPMPNARKSTNGDPAIVAPAAPEETAEQAYERAKKHVEGMK